jgi:Protein of unknown function (DUF2690)
MSTRLARAARGLVLLAAVAGGTLVAAGPATAAPATAAPAGAATAAASIYDGKLPSFDHCNDFAAVVRTKILRFTTGPRDGEAIGTVKLWWSEHCGTNYAQVVLNEPGVTGFVKVERGDGRSYSRAYSGQTSFFSQMIDGRNRCVHATASAAKDRSTGGATTADACG